MGVMLFPALFSLFVFGGLYTYRHCEKRHRWKWRGRAPEQIRRTALWSIYMGQMAVPGGLLGLYGLLVVVGVVSIPGMILAIRIWRLGYAMLRRDPGAEQEARRLEEFAIVLNAIAVGVAVVLFGFWPGEEVAFISLTLIVYAIVSFAHARAMCRCAELLAAERTRDEAAKVRAQAPVRYCEVCERDLTSRPSAQ